MECTCYHKDFVEGDVEFMILNDSDIYNFEDKSVLIEAKMKITKKKHLILTFEGYFGQLSSIPSEPGVYCIYEAKHKKGSGSFERGTLLYIGEADDMNYRLTHGHEKLEMITKDLKKSGDKPCFSFAKTKEHELAEAALIFRTTPPYNDQSTEGYHREPIVIDVEGDHHGISPKVTINEEEIT